MDRLQELVRLHRMQTGARETARLLRMSPNTERDYRLALQAADLLAGSVDELPELASLKQAVTRHLPARSRVPSHETSSLEAWRRELEALFTKGLRPRAAHDRMRLEQEAFTGSYWAVKRLWKQLGRKRGVLATDVAIPVETAAGAVAQVDFGYVGRLWDPDCGQLRRAWAFVLVLGHSRHMVVRVVFDQKTSTWLHLHVEAFAELGGCVETVVPDNLKAAVIRAAFGAGDAVALNRSYRELARHYGFKVDPTPPRDPRKKGKVESGVKYVKRNFMPGRDGQDVREVRKELVRWVGEIAGQRIHGTTGQRPLEVFEREERAALLPLPARAFELVEWKRALVHGDSHVYLDRRLYSVPWRLIGREVWVRATEASVCVFADDTRVATHARRGDGPRSTTDEHMPDHRGELRHRSSEYWIRKAELIAPEVADYVREVFQSDDVLSMLRPVQAIVTHLAKFPPERAAAACRRASFYGSYGYQALKNILARGLDFQPLPSTPPASPQLPMRFARSVTELIHQPLEDSDEPN